MISEQEILNARILIVDDQHSIIFLLEETLTEAGYNFVSSTTDPHAACELYRQNHYDLILLDLQMPVMDGFQVMECLSEVEPNGYLPVLVISAQQEYKLRALAAGAKDFITKPLDLNEVQMRIRNMLEVRLLFQKLDHANHELEKMIQKRAVELRETKALLHRNQVLMQNSKDGIHIMNMNGDIVEANETFCHMLGYAQDEISRLNVAGWDAKWSAKELRERFKWLIGKSEKFETVHRRKDGTLIDVEVATCGMEIDGKFFLYAASRDISERKRNEEALRVAAVAFETHDAILITDAMANIVRVNRAFTDITGYGEEEVLGKNPRIMSSGRQDKEFYIEMWQQLLHTGSWSGEIWDRRKSGQIYPKWLNITAVKNDKQEITHYVAIFSDITVRKQADEEIRNLAFYDALTRLPNRRLFHDRFRAGLTISARRNDYGAVLFIDLDRFKVLNDTMGHDYGDLLLVEVAGRIKSCVREMDTVARLGGDEFVVLLEGIGAAMEEASRRAGTVAEKIREYLSMPYCLKEFEHHNSPSIGISLFNGSKISVDELMQQADMAMYQAKSAGRNVVRFFDPVMQQKVAMRASLENDLHNAIALGQMQLFYQVQVDKMHRPLGAEVLLRWIHPHRGLVMPGQFIPIAEESSLILQIGDWVLEQACCQLGRWRNREQTRNLLLAVNVSPKQFSQQNFVEKIAAMLDKHHVEPRLLKLELTENLVLHDMKSAVSKMHALKQLGIGLSMDDFGTGYSSLAYLKDLPLDQIKIDQSFIRGISNHGNDALLVRTIIKLAENFNMEVIAEGVESEDQLEFLASHACPSYQGFYFGKPIAIEEFESKLLSLEP